MRRSGALPPAVAALLQLDQRVEQGLAKLAFLEAVHVTDELRAMGFLLALIFQLRLFDLPLEGTDLLGIGREHRGNHVLANAPRSRRVRAVAIGLPNMRSVHVDGVGQICGALHLGVKGTLADGPKVLHTPLLHIVEPAPQGGSAGHPKD